MSWIGEEPVPTKPRMLPSQMQAVSLAKVNAPTQPQGPLPQAPRPPRPPRQPRAPREQRPAKRKESSGLEESEESGIEEVPAFDLSAEQKSVLHAMQSGKSIFFTGCAGTGKSFTLQLLAKAKQGMGIYFTAMTGVAASLLPNATTLHSFAGIGQGTGTPEVIVSKVLSNRVATERWLECETLVIDEVSMLSRDLFEKLDHIARCLRKGRQHLPFGGIQLILCGDFFQLQPVSQTSDKSCCFESPLWEKTIKEHIELKTVFRQKDVKLVKVLGEVRYNKLSEESIALLNSLRRTLQCPPGISPTVLTPFNQAADRINEAKLNGLKSDQFFRYECKDGGSDLNMVSNLEKMTTFPTSLPLKIGAQVMLLKNQSQSDLVNGSCGVVVEFKPANANDVGMLLGKDVKTQLRPETMLPVVRFANGITAMIGLDVFKVESSVPGGHDRARREQLPIRLAWAITVHKAQGMSIDYLQVDLRSVFEAGHAYVALSRARSIDGLQILSFDPKKCWCDPKVVEFYRKNLGHDDDPAAKKQKVGEGVIDLD